VPHYHGLLVAPLWSQTFSPTTAAWLVGVTHFSSGQEYPPPHMRILFHMKLVERISCSVPNLILWTPKNLNLAKNLPHGISRKLKPLTFTLFHFFIHLLSESLLRNTSIFLSDPSNCVAMKKICSYAYSRAPPFGLHRSYLTLHSFHKGYTLVGWSKTPKCN
jgi:hypothetical protein